MRCQYCPDGHDRAKAIDDEYKERFIIIATHAGGYATPSTGWANFTTPYGEAILSQAQVTGFPSGTISRIKAEDIGAQPMKTGGMGMNRGEWRNAAEMTMGMQAPVNLGAKATFDPATRKLTVKVDIYYTADETAANNLNVAILQDNLLSKQSNTTGIDREYIQNNVLRDYITGQWGEVITEAKTKGSKITKTYTYDVPADYNGTGTSGGGAVVIEDLKVVAFVSQGRKNILNATEVEVK
ncbi:MAG: Omp28-related outer membrane protein [Bacteroidia bacterium]